MFTLMPVAAFAANEDAYVVLSNATKTDKESLTIEAGTEFTVDTVGDEVEAGFVFFVKDGVTLQFYYDDAIGFELKRREKGMFGYQGEKMGLLSPQIKWDMTCDDKIIVKDL